LFFDAFFEQVLHVAEAREAINFGVDLLAKTTVKLKGEAKGGKSTLVLTDSAQDDGVGRAGV
jgi:hypothetical protein